MNAVKRLIACVVPPLIAAATAGWLGPAVTVSAAPSSGSVMSSSVGCRDSGGATVCQRQGHSSLHTAPTPRTPNGSLFGSPWLPGYGKGLMPPLIALD